MREKIILLFSLLLIPVFTATAKEKDQFIRTIGMIKQGIVAVVCMKTKADVSIELGTMEGTGFFVSGDGTFITAGHVAHGLYLTPPARQAPCQIPAIYFPNDGWRAGEQIQLTWFKIDTCTYDDGLDLARCKLVDNPFKFQSIKLKPSVLILDDSPQKEGIPVAFTGFPLSTPQPITARGTIGTYWGLPNELPPRELVIDHNNWPGASGSPVYLSNGKVIGLILKRGINDAAGFAFARTSKYIEDFLRK
jgi:hypothetical protein